MSNHDHRCPYCGDEDVSAAHILDCQPFRVELDE